MILETERLILRELTHDDYDGLYAVLPEIGYHIRKDQQRKGYASEAAAACIRYAFENYDFPKVYSYMKYTNVASYSTAMKNGMRFIEEYEDPDNIYTRVYAITREE